MEQTTEPTQEPKKTKVPKIDPRTKSIRITPDVHARLASYKALNMLPTMEEAIDKLLKNTGA